MRRSVIAPIVAFTLLLAGFALVVAILNATVYSARGFVESYLSALQRGDAATALTLAGAIPASSTTETALLTDGALGPAPRASFDGEFTGRDGVRTVSFRLDFATAAATPAATATPATPTVVEAAGSFRVRQVGAILGLFPVWEFATPPLATVELQATNDPRFTVNGAQFVAASTGAATSRYLVFAPGRYEFGHSSAYFTAPDRAVTVLDADSSATVEVELKPSTRFLRELNAQLRDYLDECATQEVLLPANCPFGKSFENRVISTPKWSMVDYPEVRLVPGDQPLTWRMPKTDATAHLTVDVESIFDGTVTTFDKDVPFTMAYTITVTGSTLSIVGGND